MVNYCCVRGCGRNSLNASNLHFHAAPREQRRQQTWFELANRPDVLEKPVELRVRYRFCSRHFDYPSVKNRKLRSDAVPSLYLPGSDDTGDQLSDTTDSAKSHEGIKCNNCSKLVVGYRYKCLVCEDFDLCSRCESQEVHSQHFMLRVPTPVKFAKLKTIVSKWHQYHKEMEVTDYSSDDEPITKYKSYDSGVELSDEVKDSIRNSIDKALDSKSAQKKKKVLKSKKRVSETERISKRQNTSAIDDFVPMAFADVNEIPNVGTMQPLEVKTEESFIAEPFTMPMMSLKLSDDLNSLIVDVNPQKMEYS